MMKRRKGPARRSASISRREPGTSVLMGRENRYVWRDAVAIASMPERLLRMRPEMIGPDQQASQHSERCDDNCQSLLRVFCHVKRRPLWVGSGRASMIFRKKEAPPAREKDEEASSASSPEGRGLSDKRSVTKYYVRRKAAEDCRTLKVGAGLALAPTRTLSKMREASWTAPVL